MIKYILYFLIFLVITVNIPLTVKAETPKAKNGVLDLSSWSFEKNESLLLNGEWDFYWKSFRDSSNENILKVTAEVPGIWNDLPVTEGASFGYATYELKVILPKKRPKLAISIPDLYSSYRFLINGKRFNSNGIIGTSKESYIPNFTPNTRYVSSNSDTLFIQVKIANFDHFKGGFGAPIRLGTPRLFYKRVLHVSLDIFLSGSLIMGGLFFLGLYLFGNQSKPILYFALFCVVWGYRIVASGIYALHPLLDMPWAIALRLEYISMFLAALLFTKYIYHLYPKDFNRVLERIFVICFSILIFIALFFPPFYFSQTVGIFFGVVIPGFIAVAVVNFRTIYFKRPNSISALFSTFVIFFVFIYFFLQYFGIVPESVYVTFLGSLTFVFLQSLVLSFKYSRELKGAKEAAEAASNAKTEFLSTMSHEIRTPLNAVVGLSNYLIEENPRKDQEESLNNLKFASENLLSLINDILDYNKIDAGKIDFEEKPFDVRRLMESTIAAYKHIADEKGVDLSYSADSHIPKMIVGDITRISQILTNLIGNAIKFTKEGYIEVGLNLVARSANKVAIKFSVQDTGVGIPLDKQKLIFESFTQASSSTTREFGGSGLGLAITDKLLGLMGSRLFLKSAVDEGSRFYFTHFFEISEEVTKITKVATSEIPISLEGSKVLIVEDTLINIMVAKKFLEKWGMIVDQAENGALALEKLESNNYDIILMDLQMPVMDGYQASYMIRKKGDKTPIIALTAAAVTEVIEKIKDVGMNAYVTKPFNPTVLHDKIIEMINLKKINNDNS